MHKPKKKKKKPIKQKFLKRNAANEFHKALIRVFRAMDMLDCWKKLPEKIKQSFEYIPLRHSRFQKDEKSGISNDVIDALKKDIREIYDGCFIDIGIYKTSLSLSDLLTAGMSIKGSIETYIDRANEDFEKWFILHEALDILITSEDKNNPLFLIGTHMDNLCYICTSIDQAYYWFDRSFHEPTKSEPYVYIIYTLRKTLAQKMLISIENKTRPVFRLGISERLGVTWATVPSASLPGSNKDVEAYSVYVQSHAIQRLFERLAPLNKATIQVILYEAFETPEFSTGPDGVCLVALRYKEAKVGYLLCEIIDSLIVIKTFLFITQNGTNEGNTLSKKFNLSIYSKRYFELDILKTFIYTDVYKDEELKEIFTQCGCSDLFNVWKEDDEISLNENYAKNLKKIFCLENKGFE